MEDAKVAGVLADEFNKLSCEEDEECLELLRDKKRYICNVISNLGVRDLIDFECKTVAHLKSDTEKPLVREGYWEQRVEQVANALVDRYNNAAETLDVCDLSAAELFDLHLVKREAAMYLKLFGLGRFNADGKAVASIERMPIGD